MKRIICNLFLFITISMMGISCNKWLNLTPESQVSSKKLFSTPSGFRDVLNGIYIKASSDKLYGGKMTYAFTDVLAQSYKFNGTGHDFYQLSIYNYTDKGIESTLNSIWKEIYYCIANCNILLEKLEKATPVFFENPSQYKMIKGEAIALRAFFHFELLRLFAPSFHPEVIQNGEVIPYVTKFGENVTTPIQPKEFMNKVIEEFNIAKDLLNEIDPVFEPIFKKPSDPWTPQTDVYMFTQQHPSNDSFISFRGFRMNYYAITALLARAYIYNNDYKNALTCANEVITSTNFAFVNVAQISQDLKYRNRIMRSEIIMGFYVPELTENFRAYSALGTNTSKIFTIKNWVSIFGTSNSSDYRLSYLCDKETLVNFNDAFCIKYIKPLNSEVEESYGNIVPVIRFSEMYYIKAECIAQTNAAEAVKDLTTLRQKRGVYGTLSFTSLNEVLDHIVNDSRREFMSEGQLFFLYKRLNMNVLDESNTSTFKKSKFVLPIPKNGIDYGGDLTDLANQ